MPFALTEPRKAQRVLSALRDDKQPRWHDHSAIVELQDIGAIERGPDSRWSLTEIGYGLAEGNDA